MNATPFPPPPGRGRAIAELLLAVVHGDGSICLEGDAGAGAGVVLDRVAAELAAMRVRVLRVRPPPSGRLGLPELTAQVAARADPDASPEKGPELAFEALTGPGGAGGRIALLVDGADTLLPAAGHYIELACRSCPRLRVVLAGPSGFLDGLDRDGFAGLRRRIARRLHLPAPPERTPDRPRTPGRGAGPAAGAAPEPGPWLAPSAAPNPAPAPAGIDGTHRGDLWSLAGVAAAAALLLATWAPDRGGVPVGGTAVATGDGGVTAAASAERITPTVPAAGRSAEDAPARVAAHTEGPDRPGDAARAAPAPPEALPPVPAAAGTAGVAGSAVAAPAPAVPPAPLEAEVAGFAPIPLPPVPPVARPPAPAPWAAPRAPRPARGGADRAALARAPQPDWRRCRDLVLMFQMGEDVTDAERKFLHDGCEAR